ncbi:hypothetical protein EDB92DRAFT_1935686 [Lactarius akahatsu]|uniref:Uncharacterized protein n=1 Tax=Lactarius akahatsu TaxID=416441 RepID=A0AAD4QCK1_9AGAM|nr:hypothetical protein EDB92DRAFT_1935686 [Lactarius akahatsu]
MAEDPSLFSVSTLHNAQTVRSKETNASSRSRVVTKPPWAKDEPPSPTDSHPVPPSPGGSRVLSEARRSDLASPDDSSAGPSGAGEHRWFPFTRRRPPLASEVSSGSSSTTRLEKKKPAALITSLSSGLPDEGISPGERSPEQSRSRARRDWGLRITMPTPPVTPQALARTRTPGWDSPWAARPPESSSRRDIYEQLRNGESVEGQPPDSPVANESWWPRARKRARAYLLTNTYVPLLFRFVNITFTTAALAIAIRIRRVEARNGVTGVLGSSPTLVVIFAPLTLVHVMVAIYLEYFGRPLGLWRTSAKLAHTLLEVLSICAWSAALSLCFDNFFTSPIPCAGPSEISWYSDLPRPPSPFGDNKGRAGEALCDNQVALVCLVGIGLLMYCFNLVISLYRIFEKANDRRSSESVTC